MYKNRSYFMGKLVEKFLAGVEYFLGNKNINTEPKTVDNFSFYTARYFLKSTYPHPIS